jgi:hypothetical protein
MVDFYRTGVGSGEDLHGGVVENWGWIWGPVRYKLHQSRDRHRLCVHKHLELRSGCAERPLKCVWLNLRM